MIQVDGPAQRLAQNRAAWSTSAVWQSINTAHSRE